MLHLHLPSVLNTIAGYWHYKHFASEVQKLHKYEQTYENEYQRYVTAFYDIRILCYSYKNWTLLKLFDSTGQLISTQTWDRDEMPTSWEQEFTLEQKEVYFIMVQIGDQIKTEKIVVVSHK